MSLGLSSELILKIIEPYQMGLKPNTHTHKPIESRFQKVWDLGFNPSPNLQLNFFEFSTNLSFKIVIATS